MKMRGRIKMEYLKENSFSVEGMKKVFDSR